MAAFVQQRQRWVLWTENPGWKSSNIYYVAFDRTFANLCFRIKEIYIILRKASESSECKDICVTSSRFQLKCKELYPKAKTEENFLSLLLCEKLWVYIFLSLQVHSLQKQTGTWKWVSPAYGFTDGWVVGIQPKEKSSTASSWPAVRRGE